MTSRLLARGTAVLAAGAVVCVAAAPVASADQIRDQQWALKTFEAEAKVWPASQGDGVIVAVIDTGVNQDHQDLTGQVLPGADFSGGTTDGRVDADGHGTAMASLIAGHGHGAKAGVAGLAPKAKILPVKVGTQGDDSTPQPAAFADAIRFAVDHGAKVVNISLGGKDFRFDSKLRKAVNYAVSKDVVLVAAAGNTGANMDVEYPAAFPGVVAVGAIDSKGAVWEKSTSGPETTLVAPGVDIYHATAKTSTGYGEGDGTSEATAYVSATAALIRSKYPNLSAGQVINRMIKSATVPANGTVVPNDHYGYGIVAPAKALEPNSAVDNGPKENPLVKRLESKGTPPTDDDSDSADQPSVAPEATSTSSGSDNTGLVIAAAAAGVVVLGAAAAAVLMARRRRKRAAAPPYGGPGQ
ncbi:type VII secretion-associated serine protease mycosin [Kitasatospora cathayae]|uniref:Type VII secretion-associated serine protease mycosin n=1 Tax=Kitasatospora cathayae TaxID=3004092 RepID=A0ABY7Q7I5_9ACTN|nr:type VII secretion-associated serine protease mycosin [Kitasatospora sp. HUAS 3-15]WBP88645.1 type VII secretion-associated serine protease mycosin [Kitasatospora sp. HUAS 3-15]